MEQNRKVRTVTESGHISFASRTDTLCGTEIDSETRVHDYVDIEESNQSVCHDCIQEYNLWISNGGKKSPTVECECDRKMNNGNFEKCGKVTSAFQARKLNHSTIDHGVPVCRECYEWIVSVDENSVKSQYEEATPWVSKTFS